MMMDDDNDDDISCSTTRSFYERANIVSYKTSYTRYSSVKYVPYNDGPEVSYKESIS